jgi:hypothetical protein
VRSILSCVSRAYAPLRLPEWLCPQPLRQARGYDRENSVAVRREIRKGIQERREMRGDEARCSRVLTARFRCDVKVLNGHALSA